MKTARLSLGVLLAVAIALPASLAAETKKTVCVINRMDPGIPTSPALNTWVFQDVDSLTAGRVISLQGTFFTAARKPAAFHGSAAMASDGTVSLGLFVHSSARSTNDFTLSGVTDERFAGTLTYDSDGDFKPDNTIVLEAVSCDGIQIP